LSAVRSGTNTPSTHIVGASSLAAHAHTTGGGKQMPGLAHRHVSGLRICFFIIGAVCGVVWGGSDMNTPPSVVHVDEVGHVQTGGDGLGNAQ